MSNKTILIKHKRWPLWGLGLIYKIDEVLVEPDKDMEDSEVYKMAQEFMNMGAEEVDVLEDL
jgi:hypothetical protein